MNKCTCDICLSAQQKCHPLELYYGKDSKQARLVRRFGAGYPIYWYDDEVKRRHVRASKLQELRNTKKQLVSMFTGYYTS